MLQPHRIVCRLACAVLMLQLFSGVVIAEESTETDSLSLLLEQDPSSRFDSLDQAQTLGHRMRSLMYDGQFEKAEEDLDRSVLLAQDSSQLQAYLYELFMTLQIQSGRFDKAIETGADAIDRFRDNSDMLTITYLIIAIAHENRLQDGRALDYYYRALSEARASGDSSMMLMVEFNLANTLVNVGQYDSAVYYLNHALAQYRASDDSRGIGKVYNNLGTIYQDFGKVDSARYFLEESRKIHESLQDDQTLINVNLNLGILYFGEGMVEESRERFIEALEYSEQNAIIDRHYEIYRYLAAISYHDKKWNEAEKYLGLAHSYTDSVFSQNHSEAFAAAQAQFSVKENQLRAQLLGKENLEAVREVEWQRQINLLTLGVALLLGVFLSYIIWQQRKLKHLNEELISKNEALDDHLHEKDNIMGILFHDLRSPMASIKSLSDMLVIEEDLDLPDDIRELLSELGQVSDLGLQMVSTLYSIYELENNTQSIELETVKLGPVLASIEEEFRPIAMRKNIQMTVEKNGELVYTHAEFLMGILRNLVSNAIKFSPENKGIKIRVDQLNDRARIYIRDEGPGFSDQDRKFIFRKFQKLSAKPTSGESSSGLGLYLVYLMGMRINARIRLNEQYRTGAEFILDLPLSPEK